MAVILELFQEGDSANMVDNWFFESDITTDWTDANFTTAEQSSTYARFGKYSAHFADATFDGDEVVYTDLITGIVVGVEYEAGMWLKKVTCTGTGIMILSWLTAANAAISQVTTTFDTGTHDWQKYTITATAPATAAKARIHAFHFSGVTVGSDFDAYIDGVTLAPSAGSVGTGAVGYLELNEDEGEGFRMSAWHKAVASPVYGGQPGPIKESMDLMVEGASHNELASMIQELDAFRVQADAYMRDRTTAYPVWLQCKMDDETGTRRSLVRSIDMGYRLPLYAEHHGPPQNTTQVRLDIWRQPWWEDPAYRQLPEGAPSAAAAVVYDYTAAGTGGDPVAHDTVGDVGARIGHHRIYPATALAQLDRLWMGVRTANKHGTLANFVPIWECEDGTNVTDAADAVDATASDGNKVTVTPGTATWVERMNFIFSDITANYGDNFGNFLWLLRSKVSAGTWEVQLRYGYASEMEDDDFVRGPIVEIANTSWDYFEMGVREIPLRNLHAITIADMAASLDIWYEVQIWARRTDGAGTLDLDCLCLLPVDEGFLIIKKVNVVQIDNGYAFVIFGESPEGDQQVVGFEEQTVGSVFPRFVSFAPFSEGNFVLPPGDGNIICVYAQDDSSVITDTIEFNSDDTGKYYERWSSLRGIE